MKWPDADLLFGRRPAVLADYATPEFRALFRYRRLAQKAEQAGDVRMAAEAGLRADMLWDYIQERIG